jgi:hypothetical protein
MAKRSRSGLILGGHLGWEIPTGSIPLAPGANVDTASLSGGGLAFAFDGGLRFARQWYVGLTVEHASLGQGKDLSVLGNPLSISSETTALGVVLGIMVNPDRTSAYFELGLANRWYSFDATNPDGTKTSNGYTSGEGQVGLGLWIPAGSWLRLLPIATVGFGTFSAPNNNSSAPPVSSSNGSVGHTFVMLGLAGFYNLDF